MFSLLTPERVRARCLRVKGVRCEASSQPTSEFLRVGDRRRLRLWLGKPAVVSGYGEANQRVEVNPLHLRLHRSIAWIHPRAADTAGAVRPGTQ